MYNIIPVCRSSCFLFSLGHLLFAQQGISLQVLMLLNLSTIATNDSRMLIESNKMSSLYQHVDTVRMPADTVEISESDLTLISNTKYAIEIAITNDEKLQAIINGNSPVIGIVLKKKHYVAKPNNVFSSSVPKNCDLFYAVDSNGKTYLNSKNNRLKLMKIDGIKLR